MKRPCGQCGGSGEVEGDAPQLIDCPRCHGDGEIEGVQTDTIDRWDEAEKSARDGNEVTE